MPVVENDPFGGIKGEAKNFKFPADAVNKFHSTSDLDLSPNAQHHTLGPKANQASPGNHIHDGKTSKPIGAGMALTFQTTASTADQKVDRLIDMLKKVIEFTTT